ncbi:uncharacterized protein ARMOST_12824 [Armillaria ostoyae]|uniref:Uncharacterized protein n=1 Tax=Armillaria ostoyae TaxID=47428 RepID=A0A284RL13_ARMOS|nr:uncharacterized protein ARMOST_12824 [Armillaria ostoyae]
MAQLPFELVEIIISEFWYSEHPTADRITFMTGCPRICSLWRDVYASITPRDIYVPSIRYLFYLSSIIRSKKSSIYRPFLSKSTRTITCHVDLIESNLNNDPAMFAYIMFCHMPNFAGIHKCFPNIQYIHLEIKGLPGIFKPRGVDDQLIRTQVSIKLDQAKTGLSVLPVDWCITVDDPPDVDEVDPHKLKKRWSSFLTDFLRDMHQFSWMLRSIWISIEYHTMSATEGSTCSGGARHFRHRSYCEEEFGDLWSINHRFWKAARPPVTRSERHISFDFPRSINHCD